jgi:hypothetical protein
VAGIRFNSGNAWRLKASTLAPPQDAVDELARPTTWVKYGVIRYRRPLPE